MFQKEINPNNIQTADLVVCIPSYNEADSISFPAQIAGQGMAKYFPDAKSVLINCDNNSPDGTRDVFLDTPTEAPKIYLSTEPGLKGKGNNLKQKNRSKKVISIAVYNIDCCVSAVIAVAQL